MKIEEIVNPGYGYRILAKGEIIPANAEWPTIDGWGQDISSRVGPPFGCIVRHAIHRVPIDCGEGWELVPEGEEIQNGDEYLSIIGRWLECCTTVGSRAAQNTDGSGKYQAFRRRKQPAKECVNAAGEEEFYILSAQPTGVFTVKNYPVLGLSAARAAAKFSASTHGTPFTILKVVETCKPEEAKI